MNCYEAESGVSLSLEDLLLLRLLLLLLLLRLLPLLLLLPLVPLLLVLLLLHYATTMLLHLAMRCLTSCDVVSYILRCGSCQHLVMYCQAIVVSFFNLCIICSVARSLLYLRC